ncbi:MAG: putative C-S lyase [Firmicutes bacterium]|nr:putative C-S lyase [Bacillota bacterium]
MKYDFDRVIARRGTGSSKHERNTAMFGTEDVLDLWVADMDFPVPEPVVQAIKERAEHPIYGYTFPQESLLEAICERMLKRYNWKINKEWIVFNAGVVNGLYSAVQAFTHPGDEVVLQPPVYYPFYNIVKHNGCQAALNPLLFKDGRYTMDFAGLEQLFEAHTRFPVRIPRIKAIILSSPHNPVGRVWTRGELSTLAEICIKNDCMILSDEVHCDLLVKGAKHTPMATLSKEIEQHTITFMSASKTYNIAGLSTSFAIIPNTKWRQQYINIRAGHNSGNIFGLVATEAAFRYGDEYLEQLLAYLDENRDFFVNYIDTHIPQLKVIPAEGTYLAWVDMRSLGLSPVELQEFVRTKARLALDDGYAFGPGGEGFQRVNLACPRSILKEALQRLEQAVSSL